MLCGADKGIWKRVKAKGKDSHVQVTFDRIVLHSYLTNTSTAKMHSE